MMFWVCYDGRRYCGFNIQPNVRTIEGEIIKVLKELGYIRGRKENLWKYCSRTDAGVSALMNIISFIPERDVDLDEINRNLDNIWFVAKCEKEFSREMVEWKWYKYFLPYEGQDVDGMKEASKLFVGKKDFWAFSKLYREDQNTVREVIEVFVRFWKGFVVVDVIGRSFLWQMVRRIVGALDLLGRGKIGFEDIERAFEERNRKFPPADPRNLFLWFIKLKGRVKWEIGSRKNIF